LHDAQVEVFGGNDFIHKTDAESFVCVDGLPGEHHLQRGAAADEAWKALRAAVAGQDAEADLRLAKASGLRRDAYAAGHRKFAAAAERVAVDRGDDGLGQRLDAAEDALRASSELSGICRVYRRELADVRAGGEGLLACSAQKDDADGSIVAKRSDALVQLAQHRGVERVVHARAVEGDGRDGVSCFYKQGLKAHSCLS